eukprot:Amastigsp_a515781_7.p3 type:complete len:130 gc:universal Amastigsp_a515781_7:618-1007(+)
MAAMKARVLASPSPVERTPRADLLTASTIGSKIDRSADARIPGPLSRTRMRRGVDPGGASRRSRSRSQMTVTRTASVWPYEYLSAFETRFPRHLNSSSPSVRTMSGSGSSGSRRSSSLALRKRAVDENS